MTHHRHHSRGQNGQQREQSDTQHGARPQGALAGEPRRPDPARSASQPASRSDTSPETPIVVDGSNIAWLECTSDGKPQVANILKVRDALVAKGFAPVILVDAALHHQVANPQLLNELIDNQTIQQAPAQTDADYFVLETASRLGAQVVSDDQYKPYLQQYPWIPQRRVPVMIVEGMVELYREKLQAPETTSHHAQQTGQTSQHPGGTSSR